VRCQDDNSDRPEPFEGLDDVEDHLADIREESFFLSVPAKLFKKGDRLQIDVQAKDSYGAMSAILTRKWTLR